MIYNPISRRFFLQGLGGTLLAIPTLHSLLPRAHAATVPPKRFFCLAQDNGRYSPAWYPSAQAESGLRSMGTHREMFLKDISGPISRCFDTSFDSIRNKMTLIRGLDGLWKNDQGHRYSSILAGNLGSDREWETKPGPSIDQIFARSTRFNPTKTAVPNINLAAEDGLALSWVFANNTMNDAGKYPEPRAAWERLFNGFSTPTQTAPSDKMQKVSNLVFADFRALLQNPRLSNREKTTLDQHMALMVDMDNSAPTAPSPVCSVIAKPPQILHDGAESERMIKAHMDVLAAAVKCGITNIGTLMMTSSADNRVFSNLGINVPYHGDLTHVTMNSPEILKLNNFFARMALYFIKSLDVPEGDTGGTYLDNSLVLVANAMGDGYTHTYWDMPIWLAGSGGSRFRQGVYLDYTDRSATNPQGESFVGRNYCKFLVNLLEGFGVPASDYQQSNVQAGFGSDTFDYPNIAAWRKERTGVLPGFRV